MYHFKGVIMGKMVVPHQVPNVIGKEQKDPIQKIKGERQKEQKTSQWIPGNHFSQPTNNLLWDKNDDQSK